MLGMSYSDHFLSVVRPCVCPVVRPSDNTFQTTSPLRPLNQFAQISYGASLGQWNKRLHKWSRSVDQNGRHAHIWQKPLKIFFSRTEMPWCWIFAQIIREGRSTKPAKTMVIRWLLTFLWRGQVCFPMHLYGPHTFVWEKILRIQTTSHLKPLGQCCSNSLGASLK